jgi:enterochelin esterase-like enzyme
VSFRTVEISDPAYEVEGLREVTVASAALGRRADLTVYAPDPEARVPLVVLLHGVYGSHWSWIRAAGAHRVVARLVQARQLRPVALAVPSDGLWGLGSGYLPRPGEDAERWVVEEVPAAARLAAPGAGAGGVFLAGLSMGGFGALRLAALHPSRCCGAAGMSSLTDVAQLVDFTGHPFGSHPAPAGTGTLLETLTAAGDRLPPVRLDCGTEDALIIANRTLHAQLLAAGVPHEYAEHPGGHDWAYWTARLTDVLLFAERCFDSARS